MIVKNEYIKIRTNKEYTLRNWIYESYLELFSMNQTRERFVDSFGYIGNNAELIGCAIKFNTPLEDYKNSTITDFDIMIYSQNTSIDGNESSVSTLYEYSVAQGVYIANNDLWAEDIDLNIYDGKKITAIGFFTENKSGTSASIVRTIYACVDTSGYAISLDAKRGLNIARKDTISSNALCDGRYYPLHLAPALEELVDPTDYITVKVPILYSVGFGENIGQMSEEYIIGQDIELNRENFKTYSFVLSNPVGTAIHPSNDLFPGNDVYPMQPDYKYSVYPDDSLFPGNDVYPMKSGIKYIIFKYRLYYCQSQGSEITWLDEYYTMNYAYSPKGLFTIKNKIERG